MTAPAQVAGGDVQAAPIRGDRKVVWAGTERLARGVLRREVAVVLDRVLHTATECRAVSERRLHGVSPVVKVDDDVAHAKPVHVFEDVDDERLAQKRHRRLRPVFGKRP